MGWNGASQGSGAKLGALAGGMRSGAGQKKGAKQGAEGDSFPAYPPVCDTGNAVQAVLVHACRQAAGEVGERGRGQQVNHLRRLGLRSGGG